MWCLRCLLDLIPALCNPGVALYLYLVHVMSSATLSSPLCTLSASPKQAGEKKYLVCLLLTINRSYLHCHFFLFLLFYCALSLTNFLPFREPFISYTMVSSTSKLSRIDHKIKNTTDARTRKKNNMPRVHDAFLISRNSLELTSRIV